MNKNENLSIDHQSRLNLKSVDGNSQPSNQSTLRE